MLTTSTMVRLSSLLASASLTFSVTSAISSPLCSLTSKCPESAPCCSAYGHCGAGAYCLGGCDPLSSFSIQSCVARPTCKPEHFTMNTLKGMQANTIYLGDASNTNWVSEGVPVVYNDDSLLLTMAPSTSGTLLASTHYVWYGKISARLRSSAGQGVVTAFIMMSDVKDEIDFEFVGSDLQSAQSNFYWQGVTNYTNELNLTAINTNTDFHTYTIDWQEEKLTWAVDGTILRTLNKADTHNASTGEYNYPQTPARIQLSLWPAGTTKSAPGTVEWAGGLINWDSPYMQNGYYYAQVKEVSVECAHPPAGADVQGSASYQYTDYSGLQASVQITDDNTVLGSFYATGQDPKYNPNQKSSSGGSPKPKPSDIQVVPGISGGGVRSSGGSGGGLAPVPGTGTDTGGGGFASSVPGSGSNTFTQGLDNGASTGFQKTTIVGSAFAALVAMGALLLS